METKMASNLKLGVRQKELSLLSDFILYIVEDSSLRGVKLLWFFIMEMYFVTKVKFTNLLFYGLDINNTSEMVGGVHPHFSGGDAVRVPDVAEDVPESADERESPGGGSNPQQDPTRPDAINSHDEAILLSSLRIPVSVRQIQSRRLLFHSLSTLNNVFHVFWGYLIMLLVMTYSVWLTIAVIAGCGLGYYIFGAIRHTLELKHTLQGSAPGDDGPPGDNNQCHQPVESMHM